jgi:hypothetical protein
MNLQIQANDFALTDGLRQHVATRLACALNHGQEVVTRVVVRLADVNADFLISQETRMAL